ncbi:MAG TPA: helix-turn-helix domain-containing protein [Solirubrobacterales bacterium]|nr:helix-turn-helix domain-containing protein [Solirubrobacterales bacterium]
MQKEFLEECLGEGLSLEAIGKRVGKHESTVSYWLKKHGLSAPGAEKHAAKGAPPKDELERLLRLGMSLREIAKEMDRSLATIRHWMKRYDLKARAHRHNAPDDGTREATLRCRKHGETSFVLEGRGYYRCKRCRLERVGRRRRTIKSRLVAEAGGKCVICGYHRCHRALQFHHLDPRTKEFHLGHTGVTRSLARSRAEARKCILLCANCHAEVEAGITAVPLNSVPKANPE